MNLDVDKLFRKGGLLIIKSVVVCSNDDDGDRWSFGGDLIRYEVK
jgi:hypothetical protein